MTKIKNSNKIFVINLFTNILYTMINVGIGFFLTPFLTNNVGAEAYGFVNLANTMINNISIITVALNSVAGRYIAISVHRNDMKKANSYYSSVFWANVILVIAISIITIPTIINLNYFLSIPEFLSKSVQILFLLIYLNYILTIITNIFTLATFICNQLYLANIGSCITGLLRAVLLLLMFSIFPTNIIFIGIATLISSMVLSIYNIVLTRKLMPELYIKISDFSIDKVFELFFSGVWNSVTKLTQILSDGLDLLVSNIGISSLVMGQISISYTIPNMVSMLASSIIAVFNPKQTYFYACNRIDNVIKEIKKNMKLCGFFVSILFCGIITYGKEFYSFYVPNQDIELIYRLTILALLPMFICGVSSALDNVFLLTNKLKINSIVWLVDSFFCVSVMLLCVKFTDYGAYAIVGTSKIMGFILYLTYVPIYASKSLKVRWSTFYPIFIRYVLNTVVMLLAFILFKMYLPQANNIFYFIFDCTILFFVGVFINVFVFFDKKDRVFFLDLFKQKVSYKIIK